jgi:hypothetical protein
VLGKKTDCVHLHATAFTQCHNFSSPPPHPQQYQHLDRITAAVQSGDDAAITRQLHASTLSPEQAALLEAGFQQIRDLDSLFLQKNSVARTLKRERLERERTVDGSTTTSNAPSDRGDSGDDDEENGHGKGEGDEEEEESLELKSVHSYEERTFLTEPRLAVRRPIGKEALLERGGMRAPSLPPSAIPTLPSIASSAFVVAGGRWPKESAKAYVPGNFIQRNIAVCRGTGGGGGGDDVDV